MDKKILKSKFSEYLEQKGKSLENLDKTIERFGATIFDMFFDGLEYLDNYKDDPEKHYNQVFNRIVLPQMKHKIRKQYGDIYFKPKIYERYKSLFISFMKFVEENRKYINELKLGKRKEKIENSLQGLYGNYFNKKALVNAWHNYIQSDNGKNGDKLREYLADIYGSLSDEELKNLYDILFDSYEICSRITSENHENKGKEGFEKKDAFEEAFLNLKDNLGEINGETLSKIKSIFGKYLNFIPRYRDKLITTIKGKPEQGEHIQKDTETRLLNNFGESISKNWGIPGDYSYEGDGFGPTVIVSSDENGVLTERGDILPPDEGIFPDENNSISEGEVEETPNNGVERNNGTEKKSEKPAQGIVIHFDDEEKEEEGENPNYTGDYTDSYKNR